MTGRDPSALSALSALSAAKVHAVTDATVLFRPDFLDLAASIAALGPSVAIHLRDRTAPASRIAALAESLAPRIRDHGAILFINARPDIAQAVGAEGVQLGEQDLGVRDARAVFPRGLIGRSVHDEAGARKAIDDGADFVMLGPIWPTATHPGQPGKGLEALDPRPLGPRPIITIGGITPDRARQARRAGFHGVAAITGIWHAADPVAATRELLDAWADRRIGA